MKLFLIVAKGKRKGEPIPIEHDLFLIGSGEMCQLRAAHESLGEQHCAIVKRDRKVFVRDLDSGGPTLVNDEEIPISEEWPLHAGDFMQVGPLRFVVQFNERPLSKKDLEEWALKCVDLDTSRHITAMDMLERIADTKQANDAATAASAMLEKFSEQTGVVKGRLRISREGGVTIVRINDSHLVEEAEIAHLRKELLDNLNRHNLKVLLDMKSVHKLSSAAVDLFGELQNWLRSYGSRLALCRVHPEMLAMLRTFPVMRPIRFFNDKPHAIQATW